MAKKIEYLDKSISEVLDSSESALKRQIGKSIEQVYDTRNINYIAAYQRVVSTLAERTLRGNITQNKLEKIASLLKVREPRKEREETPRDRKETKVEGLTYEEFCKKRPDYSSFEEIKADYPKQDLGGFEGAYGRYVLKKKKAETITQKAEARKGEQEIDGQEYRKLFTKTFRTEDPTTVNKKDIKKFDAEILGIYDVPNGENQLRAYRAHFHKSW